MGNNQFGRLFTITTWGESHGKAIGVVIDGCPPNLPLCAEEIDVELARRRPGASPFTSPRQESDRVTILSGVYQDRTTGAPICLMIENRDADSTAYNNPSQALRPGHADFTYQTKYGHYDPRGGGRASARETAARVAAGAIAKKLLRYQGIDLVAYIQAIGPISAEPTTCTLSELRSHRDQSPLFCPDPMAEKEMRTHLESVKNEGDSLGGIVELIVAPMIAGLGDPVYEKLQANLAKAMMSLPAAKGFEIGSGFAAARMRGTEHNDLFSYDGEQIQTTTNHAGGVLGGISTGMPLTMRVAFKPTSSIKKPQMSVTPEGEQRLFELSAKGRHDPCVAIRAVPVVEAMAALVLIDALLIKNSADFTNRVISTRA